VQTSTARTTWRVARKVVLKGCGGGRGKMDETREKHRFRKILMEGVVQSLSMVFERLLF